MHSFVAIDTRFDVLQNIGNLKAGVHNSKYVECTFNSKLYVVSVFGISTIKYTCTNSLVVNRDGNGTSV